jgi:hypothetical protein
MNNEPQALKEVHRIRAEIYEETKNMTPSERADYANAQAQLLIEKYKLNLNYENKTNNFTNYKDILTDALIEKYL